MHRHSTNSTCQGAIICYNPVLDSSGATVSAQRQARQGIQGGHIMQQCNATGRRETGAPLLRYEPAPVHHCPRPVPVHVPRILLLHLSQPHRDPVTYISMFGTAMPDIQCLPAEILRETNA